MAEDSHPTIHLRLTPSAGDTGDIISLHFKITLKGFAYKSGELLCSFGRKGVPRSHPSWYPYYLPHDTSLTFSDESGPLVIALTHETSHQAHIDRETYGDIIAQWEVPAFDEDGSDRVERLDVASTLHRDQGGVIGAGRYFLPRFAIGRACQCQMTMEWDLSDCPGGTRAVCSFGEGPEPITISGSGDTLLDCAFMVGPIHSYPPEPPQRGLGDEGFCGTYWFGGLPSNIAAVKDYPTNIFPRMAEHFKDENGSYRAFIRRVPQGPRLASSVFLSSSIVEYDDNDSRNEHDWDLVRLFNRAMVSTWARLDAEDDGTENDWFTDGLALLYTVFLPFRFGQRGPDYFRATVNAFLSAYYTNPLVKTPWSKLDAKGPEVNHCWYTASARAQRAFVYMLKMDCYTRRAAVARGADVSRPLDELVRDLLVRRRGGGIDQAIQKKDWMAAMASWLGQEEADRNFREMIENDEGRVNEMDDMLSSFGTQHGPHPVEKEMLEFGFDRKSLTEGAVSGTVEGSRAREAGLKDGDRIVWYSRPEACELDMKEHFKLVVERSGDKVDIEYWPRSKGMLTCWQILEGKYEPPTK